MFSHSKMKTEFNKNHNRYEVTMDPPGSNTRTIRKNNKISIYFLQNVYHHITFRKVLLSKFLEVLCFWTQKCPTSFTHFVQKIKIIQKPKHRVSSTS